MASELTIFSASLYLECFSLCKGKVLPPHKLSRYNPLQALSQMQICHTERTHLGVESEFFPTAATLTQQESNIAKVPYLCVSVA